MCGEFNLVYKTVDAIVPTKPHGGAGGVPLEAWCAPPYGFISSITFSIRSEDKIASYVDAIAFTCTSLANPKDSLEKHCLGNEIACGNLGKGFGALHTQRCHWDEAATGIRGKAEAYVNALGLMCGQKPGKPVKSMKKAPPSAPPPGGQTEGIDLPGNDIRNLVTRNEFTCKQTCGADGGCRAWTFVKNGSKCWLKNAVPAAVRSGCCISGVMAAAGDKPVKSMKKTPKPADAGGGTVITCTIVQPVDVCRRPMVVTRTAGSEC
jgi:hypothetical protein